MITTIDPIVLGIDTGGTFTDGVLLNPLTREVIKSVKVLTTHHDLRICIAEVLECLVPENPSCISLVALSTTLATNAIAEGKRKPVALLLLGYDPDLVHQFKFQHQFGTHHYFFIPGRHDLNGVEQNPLDLAETKRIVLQIQEQVDAFAVSSYAGPMNSSHEESAAEIISGLTGHPVIQAHHLSNELDSIRRATTVSLNASLLSNIQEFLDAIQKMIARKGIICPIMMIKGDGSIVKADFARKRPVEIIHSGPATSAIGGQFLAGVDKALVIDIGGTTTDIAYIEKGKVQIQEHAATVGTYRTCVKTIKVRSFGLGGDSLVRFDHWKNLAIGPQRVVPLSHLCYLYPEVKQDLTGWLNGKKEIRYWNELEYWVLRREPQRPIKDNRTKKAIELLRKGPQRLSRLLKDVGAVSPVQLYMDDLVNQEIIDIAGLTPTDLLHVTGEFSPWDADIARMVADVVAKNWGESAEAFIQRVKREMVHRMVAEIIQFLSNKTLSESFGFTQTNNLDRWMYEESLDQKDAFLGCSFFLKVPIVGIGAPAKAFLPAVAQAFRTEFILPEHYEVANAVGTVVGNVMVSQEGEVFPSTEGTAITGYYARVDSTQQKFEKFDDALAFARQALSHQVALEMNAAGAYGTTVECDENEIWPGMVKLSAWAIGKPGSPHANN